MNMTILLDAGPLGEVTNPRGSEETQECKAWLKTILSQGVKVMVPEIADYEVRRELLRAGKAEGLARLDALEAIIDYIPITTEAMLKAAEFWAFARNQGKPTADDKALDADVILAAQASLLMEENVVIATENVGHLSLFVEAKNWRDIDFP